MKVLAKISGTKSLKVRFHKRTLFTHYNRYMASEGLCLGDMCLVEKRTIFRRSFLISKINIFYNFLNDIPENNFYFSFHTFHA